VTPEEAERYLLSLELFGMRFGLDRMRRLMTALDNPQLRFESIHVVGTNGKSSTVRMIAAILQRHGLRTGAYLSPHLVSYGERIRVDGQDLEPAAFAAAVQRARRAVELVNRSLASGDRVTQFEALTAAAYSELAARGVDVAVIEAGLGGRYDATNVIPSRVQVLTSVGLEHTRWLGPTIADIAREKLDVVQPGGTLVLGHALGPSFAPKLRNRLGEGAKLGDAVAVAEEVAAQRGARIVRAPADPGVPVGAPGAYQRRNFALARTAAEAYLGQLDTTLDATPGATLGATRGATRGAARDALDPRLVAEAAAAVRIPGRLQTIAEQPLTLLDSAHNPEAVAALVESLPEVTNGRRPLIAMLSVLDDKDAAAMLRELAPAADALIFTSSQNPRALPPPTLDSLATQLGGPSGEIVPDPLAALARARELAGAGGAVLATGSIYLIADLVRQPASGRASML
jgi:dihydrofolate synthase/folylpolyglutamate synthase